LIKVKTKHMTANWRQSVFLLPEIMAIVAGVFFQMQHECNMRKIKALDFTLSL